MFHPMILTIQKLPNQEATLTTKKKPDYKIDPQEYRSMLKSIQLENIWLEECSAKIRKDKTVDNSPVEVSVNDKLSYEIITENLLHISHSFEVIATPGSKKEFVFKIASTFKLRYSSEAPLSESFVEIFKDRNVPINTWPYFREFVQSITQRMNIPPLTLPLLKR
jgi:preprotein translocase subunit SecB